MLVTKSVTINDVPEWAFEVLTSPEGPITETVKILRLFGGTGRAYQEGTGMVFEATGVEAIVDIALNKTQEKVPEFVTKGREEAEALILLALLMRGA